MKTPEGAVQVDPSGKANGRGAYVHNASACWDEALAKDRLGRALRTSISDADQSALRDFGATASGGDK